MTVAPRHDPAYRLALAAPAAVPALARTLVAHHLRLAPAEADARLARGDLAGPLERGQARRLMARLRAGGLDVHARPHAQGARRDLALIPRHDADLPALAAALAARLDRSAPCIAAALRRPGGLVLEGLDPAIARDWQAVARRLPGLCVVLSDPAAAIYDLLPWGEPSGPVAPFLRHLRVLGLGPCPLTGGPGAGLDAMLRDHVMRRFPAAGVIAVDRAFQRFDLLLIRAPGLSAQDLAGFLGLRAGVAPQALAGCGPDRPLTIDRGIARAAALRFQSEYAAIGIDTRLRPTVFRADPLPSAVCPRR